MTTDIPVAVEPGALRTPAEMVHVCEAAIQHLVANAGQGTVNEIAYQGQVTKFSGPMTLAQLRNLKRHYEHESAASGGERPLSGPFARRHPGRIGSVQT